MKITELERTAVYQTNDNGGRKQTIYYKDNNNGLYKIEINSESHEKTSYAYLYKWTGKRGYKLILRKNPKRDFNIDLAHKDYDNNSFEPIIKDLLGFLKKAFGKEE